MKNYTNIFSAMSVLGAATSIPETFEDAAGHFSGTPPEPASQRKNVVRLPVSRDLSGPERAVEAGIAALARSGKKPESIAFNIHCSVFHQGHEKWSPAHYVASKLGVSSECVPLGLRMLCSSGGVAVSLAQSLTLKRGQTILISGGERYRAPEWDRWDMHPDIGYGDAGAAVLLGEGEEGEYIISAASIRSDYKLEQMDRGNRPFTERPLSWPNAYQTENERADFYSKFGKARLKESSRMMFSECLRELKQQNAEGLSRAKMFIPPRLGPRLESAMFGAARNELLDCGWHRLGSETGHVGGVDTLLSVSDVIEQKLLNPGEAAVIAGGGGGFTWTALLLERRD
jgi:putative 3-oxoacyl-ACP synthase III